MTDTKDIIHFIQKTQWEDLPAPVQHQAKRCLLDGLGSLLAGTAAPVAKIAAGIARDQFPGEQGTIAGTDSRVSAIGAALANGFAANALDVDDGHRMIKGHPGAPLYPVLLAASELEPVSGREFLTSQVIGYEVGIRAGLIRHQTMTTYHSSGSWGAIGGAAAGGRLLGLDDGQLRHALGAADYHAPIAPMMRGIATPSMGKDSIGWGCLVAMSSLLLARQGFTGIQPLFDDDSQTGPLPVLGKDFEILNVYFKPYCGCRWAHPAVEATLAVMKKYEIAVGEIEEILVSTFREAAALSTRPPRNTEEAQYNMAFPIAAALLDGQVGPDQVLPPRIHDPDLADLMGRVRMETKGKYQQAFPARALAEVTIMTREGNQYDSGTYAAPWDPDSTLPSDAELEAKFRTFVEPILGADRTRNLQDLIWSFDEAPRADAILELCARA